MKISLKGQTAVVYGAGRGIGESIATELTKAGATVYVADLMEENCNHVVNGLKKQGFNGVAVKCDVSSYADVDSVMAAAVRRMQKYNRGKIVSTASFAGRHAMKEGFAYYGMTKAAIIYLTQAVAYAGADYNINVNSVCPGIIRTPMWEKILDSYVEAGEDRETSWKRNLKHFIPLERGDQKPEDIAYTVLFLCSEYADHITGQAINVDGGAAMN